MGLSQMLITILPFSVSKFRVLAKSHMIRIFLIVIYMKSQYLS